MTEVDYMADGSSNTIVSPYYLYRFVDGIGRQPGGE